MGVLAAYRRAGAGAAVVLCISLGAALGNGWSTFRWEACFLWLRSWIRNALRSEGQGAPCSDVKAVATPAPRPPPSLCDVLVFALPALDPLTALRMRALAKSTSGVLQPAVLRSVASGPEWKGYLAAAALPLASLLCEGDAVDARSLARSAGLAPLAPGGVGAIWGPDARGRSPFALAVTNCRRRRQDVLQALLAASPQEPSALLNDGRSGSWTPLMWAAHFGDLGCCDLLLRARARPNALTSDGTSALLCATRADRAPLKVVTMLLAHGADASLVPLQSPFDEHIDIEVRQALTQSARRRVRV